MALLLDGENDARAWIFCGAVCVVRDVLYPILEYQYQYCMLNGNTRGLGGTHILPNIDCKIQRGAVKEVSSTKNSIDWCTIPESTNAYLVKANAGGRKGGGGRTTVESIEGVSAIWNCA